MSTFSKGHSMNIKLCVVLHDNAIFITLHAHVIFDITPQSCDTRYLFLYMPTLYPMSLDISQMSLNDYK